MNIPITFTITLCFFLSLVIAVFAIRTFGIARALAVARKAAVMCMILSVFDMAMTSRVASASGPDVIVDTFIDAAGDLQMSVDNQQIDDELTGSSSARDYDFVDPDEEWPLKLVSATPSTAMTCTRGYGVLSCTHDGATDVDLVFEATSQATGATKRKPVKIIMPPTTQPGSTNPTRSPS